MIDVIIVNYNTAHLLARMFAACDAAGEGLALRYWVVDNASKDDSVAVLRRDHPGAFVQVNAENVGFGRANNQMVEHLKGEYVLLLNTDAFVARNTLQVAIDCLRRRKDVGAVGVRLTTEDGQLQPSCRYFPTPWNMFLQRTSLSRWFTGTRLIDDYSWDHAGERVCDWVPGCFLLIRKQVIDDIGLFDPCFFLYFEEVDLCKRIKAAGWKVLYTGATSVVHLGGESAKTVGKVTSAGKQISALQVESELLYVRKHHGLAGLWGHLALAHLGDAITAAKDVFKGRGWAVAWARFEHGAALRRMCRQTRWGAVPTR